jgi:ABC-type nitrate/sulfonate/bicarbonate transport system substrate-binding protein
MMMFESIRSDRIVGSRNRLPTGFVSGLRTAAAGLAALMLLPAGSASAEKVTLFLGTTPDYANVYVARDKGFFAEEGIELDVRLFPSGTAATDGFRSGTVEFVASGEIPALRLCDAIGSKVIAATGFDGFSPVFMVKSDIASPADLKGKRIGTRIGSSGEMFADLVRQKYDLPPDTFELINLEPTDMVAALDRGDIDGFLWFSPFEERSAEISGDRVRLLLRGGEVDYTNEVTLTARADLTTDNQDMLTRFLRALAKGSDYAAANRDETVEIVAAALKLDTAAAEVTRQLNYPVALDDRVYDRYGKSADFMLAKQMSKERVDLDKCFWADGLRAVDPARVKAP